MRVTKTIKEYVEKEVQKRLMPKYEVEKAEADRQNKLEAEFINGCREAAQQAYLAYFHEHFPDVESFCEKYGTDKDLWLRPSGLGVRIPGYGTITGVHCWESRLHQEALEKTKEIIFQLELGGNKDLLMELLNNI